MLDATRANAKTEAFNDAFAAIGTPALIATRMPPCKRNTEPAAWEYHAASHLLRLADARKKKAVKAAIVAGVMFNHEKAPLPIGTQMLFYAGEVVEISVAVSTPTTGFHLPEFCADLEKAGMKPALIARLLARHTYDNAAPHKFSSSLVTG